MDISSVESLGWLLTYGIVAAVVFVIIRQAVLWYFRINQMADNLQVIADHYRKIDGIQKPSMGQYHDSGSRQMPKEINRRLCPFVHL